MKKQKSIEGPRQRGGDAALQTEDWDSVNCESWKSSSHRLRSFWAIPHANLEVGH